MSPLEIPHLLDRTGKVPPEAASTTTTVRTVDQAVAIITEMPDTITPFTACSCSHSRPAANPVSSSSPSASVLHKYIPPSPNPHSPSNPNEYASALVPTIKAAQKAHARMEQCREWVNVVAVAARDAEHAVPGTGASNPYANQKGLTPPAYNAPKAPRPHPGPLSNAHRPAAPTSAPAANGHHNQYPTLTPPAQVPAPLRDDVYPPTAPAKWYDDPVADALSRSGSRAVSRANTPPFKAVSSASPSSGPIAPSSPSANTAASAFSSSMSFTKVHGRNDYSLPVFTQTTSAGNGVGAEWTHRRPSTSALTALYFGADPTALKRQHVEDDVLEDEPFAKRRSAPASPARPHSKLLMSLRPSAPASNTSTSTSTSPDIRPRPLLTGTIASRTGPALAQVRAAFASVGVSESGDSVPVTRTSPPRQ